MRWAEQLRVAEAARSNGFPCRRAAATPGQLYTPKSCALEKKSCRGS
jgi:hypothetical protein